MVQQQVWECFAVPGPEPEQGPRRDVLALTALMIDDSIHNGGREKTQREARKCNARTYPRVPHAVSYSIGGQRRTRVCGRRRCRHLKHLRLRRMASICPLR